MAYWFNIGLYWTNRNAFPWCLFLCRFSLIFDWLFRSAFFSSIGCLVLSCDTERKRERERKSPNIRCIRKHTHVVCYVSLYNGCFLMPNITYNVRLFPCDDWLTLSTHFSPNTMQKQDTSWWWGREEVRRWEGEEVRGWGGEDEEVRRWGGEKVRRWEGEEVRRWEGEEVRMSRWGCGCGWGWGL